MIKNWLNKFKISLPPLPTPPPAHALEKSTLLLLATAILVAVLAHYSIASPVIATLALLVWGIKTGLIIGNKKNPPSLLIVLLTIVSILMILVFYGGWNGQKAGISFLVLLVTLKFLESATLRDYFVICLLLLFVASASFLFHNTLTIILLVASFVIIVIALLVTISNPSKLSFGTSIKRSLGLILRALPLAILLFFLFPRIQGDFGFLPSQDRSRSDEELSNSLVAGEFSSQAFSDELAFRVEFEGATPRKNRLYWRVKVMEEEFDFTWRVQPPSLSDLRQAKEQREASVAPAEWGEPIRYSIVHENSSDQFLPFLDYVYSPNTGIQLDDHSVFKSETTDGVFAYRGSSYNSPTISAPLTNQERQSLLQTKSVPSARTAALMLQWRGQTQEHRQLANLVFAHFKNNNFQYTLEPPELYGNPLDSFLFDTRAGYCEHYASAFTTLMRWLGVPARVVVGYLGGELNSVGQFVEVNYRDAHAWSEVWIDGSWQRIDPTAAASETRIEQGMDAFLNLWEQRLANGDQGRALADYLNPTSFQRMIKVAKQSWENLGYQWNKWVVNYDFNTQRELLAQLGLENRNTIYTLITLLSIGLLILMLFYFWQLIPKARKLGDAQQAYIDFLYKFKRQGIEKIISETPNEFGIRAATAFPSQATEIKSISNSYSQIRYGKIESNLDSFKSQVKQFKLKPEPPNPDSGTKIMKKISDDFFVAGQLNAADFSALASAGVKTIINNRPDDEESGQLSFSAAQELAAEHGMNYIYLPMKNGHPLPPTLVDEFKSALDAAEKPVLAHCRSGFRSSFLWSMGQIAAGNITADEAIKAANNVGIPLEQARAMLESQ